MRKPGWSGDSSALVRKMTVGEGTLRVQYAYNFDKYQVKPVKPGWSGNSSTIGGKITGEGTLKIQCRSISTKIPLS